MNRKINKYYFDINSEAKYIFLNAKMVCIICCPIQYVHIFRSCHRMPVNIQTSGIHKNGINVVKNGFLFYDVVFSVKIITAFLRMSTILIYILVFSPVWIPFIS